MSYLIGIVVLVAALVASATWVLIALARLAELLPQPGVSGEEEDATAGSVPAKGSRRQLLQ
jgi:hypothetical protein